MGRTLQRVNSITDGENNTLWGFIGDATIDGPLNVGNSEIVQTAFNMKVQKVTTPNTELRAIAKIQLPPQPDGAGDIVSLSLAFSAQVLLTNTIGFGETMTFFDNSPAKDTIAITTLDWGVEGVVDGCQIVISGSVSNNGTYTVFSHTSSVLTLVASDSLTNETVFGFADAAIYAPPDRDIYIAKGDYGDWTRSTASWDHRLQNSSGISSGLAEWVGSGSGSTGPGSPANIGGTESYNDVYISRIKRATLLSVDTANDGTRSRLVVPSFGKFSWGDRFDIMIHSEQDSSNQGILDLGSADNSLNTLIHPNVIIDFEKDDNTTDTDFLDGDFSLSINTAAGREGRPLYNAKMKNTEEGRLLSNIFGFYAESSIQDNLIQVGIDNQVFRTYISENSHTGLDNVPVTMVRNVLDNALVYDVILKGFERDGTPVTDTLSFTNGGPDSLSSDPMFYLYHIEIDAASATNTPNFLDATIAGTIIANVPEGTNGVLFTAIESSETVGADLTDYAEGTATPLLDVTDDVFFFNVWKQTAGLSNEVSVNRANPIKVDVRYWTVVTRAPRELPKGTPSSTGLTGDEMFLKFTNPTGAFATGVSVTHIDVSYFRDSDGNRVYRRIPFNRATLSAAGVNEVGFIYTRDGTFINEFRFVAEDVEFATEWLDYDAALDVTINTRDPTALLEVIPRIVRIGKEVSIDGRLSGTGAGNVTITDFSSRAWAQDFGNDGAGGPDPLTPHPNSGLSPIRKHTYLKSEIGQTLPKVVRVELQVTDSVANTALVDTEILVNDNIPIDLYSAMVGTCPTLSRITAVPETQTRANTKLKASPDGNALVDQGDAGITASISGTIAGPDINTLLETLRKYQREQTFITVPVFERNEDTTPLVRKLRGVLTGGLDTPHEGGDRKVAWSAEMFVEDAILADADGYAEILLRCGDDLPGVGLLDMTDDDEVTKLVVGDMAEIRSAVDGSLIPGTVFAIGDGAAAGAGQFEVTRNLQMGSEYFIRVYNDPNPIITGTTKRGDSAVFKPLRPGTVNIRGVSTLTLTS